MESLLQKAKRLQIQPLGDTSPSESLLDKALRLGIQPTPAVKEPNYFQRVGASYQQAGQDIMSAVTQGAEAIQKPSDKLSLEELFRPTRTALRTVGAVASAAFAPILEAPIIKPLTEKIVGKVAENPSVKNILTEGTALAQKYPEFAKDFKNVFDIVTLGTGKAVEAPLATEIKAISKDISQGVRVALSPSEQVVQNNIIELFNKSIKPSKKSISQGVKYENKTLNALKTIKANADQLNIEDSAGEIVSRTPQTIQELSQAVNQTKKLVFDQYDAVAKKAGTAGATIDAKPIASEVLQVAQNKALQITNPEIIKYAEDWAKRLQGLNVLDTETTQAVIQNLNKSLEAFYRNPTYESASKAAVDAGVANNFRKALDEAIENATGEQYQILKNQYSALKAIESDVIGATARDAKRNVKGLLDYTDIFTSGQMVGGILSLNPAMFTKGAVERGFKEYLKFLNDPNRAISNIFENLNIDTSAKFTPTSKTGAFIQNPKLGMSIEDVSRGNLQSSISKAKASGQSFNEWVKGQGNEVYRGVSGGERTFDVSSKGALSEQGFFSVTPTKSTAKAYGDSVVAGNISKGAKIKELPDYSDIKGIDYKKLKQEGNDIVKFLNRDDEIEMVVLNPNVLKTRSQLKAEWDKVK